MPVLEPVVSPLNGAAPSGGCINKKHSVDQSPRQDLTTPRSGVSKQDVSQLQSASPLVPLYYFNYMCESTEVTQQKQNCRYVFSFVRS